MNKPILKTLVALSLPALTSLSLQASADPGFIARADLDYQSRARFPEWSQPLPPGSLDPLVTSRTPSVQTTSNPDGANPVLSIWSSDIRYELGDTAKLYARLVDAGTSGSDGMPMQTSSGVGGWAISAELVDNSGKSIAKLNYRDDGKGGDEQAGDGTYTASYQLPEDIQPPVGRATNIGVKIAAVNEASETRYATSGFLYSHPAGELTGKFKDSVSEGNLKFGVEVRANSAGRFHLSGVVADPSGNPIATAQTSVELQAGVHWVDLTAYGLILREKNVAGSLSLASVTLTSTGSMPNALGKILTDAHSTSAYLPIAFTDKVFKK